MHKITRREFLKVSAGTAISLGTPGLFTNCERTKTSSLAPLPRSSVAAIRGENLDAMTRDALDALGGMSAIVHEGETVFIKPNFVSFPWARTDDCFRSGECTKPEIIIAVMEECLKCGAREVIIGDGSQMPTFDWQYAITLDGKTSLVQEAERFSTKYGGKVKLACLEADSPDWVEVPSRSHLSKIAISGLVAKADRVISIPVAKTHSWAQLTLALKNFVGITSLARYAQWVNNSYWNRGTFDHGSPEAIGQIYLDVVAAVKPDLAVIDFSIGIEGDGPTRSNGGTTVDMKDRFGSWAIVASTDIMAADATAARMMNHDTRNVKQLGMGYDMGLGQIGESSIELLGEKLENMQAEWKPARLKG